MSAVGGVDEDAVTQRPRGGATAADAAAAPTGSGEDLRATRRQVLARALLPRSREMLLKLPLVPLGAAVALVAAGRVPGPAAIVQLVVLWVVVEPLAYQARYQLNDLRDRAADAAHPERDHRGRLTFPWTPARAAVVWGSLGARVAAAVALAVLLPGSAGEAATGFLVLLVLVSGAYELARERVRRAGPVAPDGVAARRLGLPVLACVPLGYGLRVWTGYHAAAGGELPPVLGILLVATVLATYTACVLLAWALEATTFLGERGAPPAEGLGRRAHVALLLAHAGLLSAEGRSPRPVPGRALVVARDRPAGSALDVRAWDVAGAVAVVGAYLLAGAGTGADGAVRAVLVAAGLLSAAAPSLVHLRSRPGSGPWDGRAPWLAPGSLAVVVALEWLLLAGAMVAVLVLAPAQARLLWVPAFVLFQVGSTRTSSYERGFGPLSTVRRPLAWLRRRRGQRGPGAATG
ncbi:hypothetical protein WDZ16_08555 [Pseudokineococcus marinus]|uniref:Uncharacterized protein n=1 Tax=Pseudokineococcus marinus TaxID=351215 RepID=A0A849BSJ2_9ACTN|nr:hypothetical protein [Pseudokineococcus marinus]NNH24393.1 hypothetical protein [Pseudokineococcus marinus]